jgi:hypothetical protein
LIPEAVVDETAPIVDVGGSEEAPHRTRGGWPEYLGPKIPASWNKPHPQSYGAKDYPLHSTGRFKKVRSITDALSAFVGSAGAVGEYGTLLCSLCHGSGLSARPCEDVDCQNKCWRYGKRGASHFGTCTSCGGSGKKADEKAQEEVTAVA